MAARSGIGMRDWSAIAAARVRALPMWRPTTVGVPRSRTAGVALHRQGARTSRAMYMSPVAFPRQPTLVLRRRQLEPPARDPVITAQDPAARLAVSRSLLQAPPAPPAPPPATEGEVQAPTEQSRIAEHDDTEAARTADLQVDATASGSEPGRGAEPRSPRAQSETKATPEREAARPSLLQAVTRTFRNIIGRTRDLSGAGVESSSAPTLTPASALPREAIPSSTPETVAGDANVPSEHEEGGQPRAWAGDEGDPGEDPDDGPEDFESAPIDGVEDFESAPVDRVEQEAQQVEDAPGKTPVVADEPRASAAEQADAPVGPPETPLVLRRQIAVETTRERSQPAEPVESEPARPEAPTEASATPGHDTSVNDYPATRAEITSAHADRGPEVSAPVHVRAGVAEPQSDADAPQVPEGQSSVMRLPAASSDEEPAPALEGSEPFGPGFSERRPTEAASPSPLVHRAMRPEIAGEGAGDLERERAGPRDEARERPVTTDAVAPESAPSEAAQSDAVPPGAPLIAPTELSSADHVTPERATPAADGATSESTPSRSAARADAAESAERPSHSDAEAQATPSARPRPRSEPRGAFFTLRRMFSRQTVEPGEMPADTVSPQAASLPAPPYLLGEPQEASADLHSPAPEALDHAPPAISAAMTGGAADEPPRAAVEDGLTAEDRRDAGVRARAEPVDADGQVQRTIFRRMAASGSSSEHTPLVYRTIAPSSAAWSSGDVASPSDPARRTGEGAIDREALSVPLGVGGAPDAEAAYAISREHGMPVATTIARVETDGSTPDQTAPPAQAAEAPGGQGGSEADLQTLAGRVYDVLRRRLIRERERAGTRAAWFHG